MKCLFKVKYLICILIFISVLFSIQFLCSNTLKYVSQNETSITEYKIDFYENCEYKNDIVFEKEGKMYLCDEYKDVIAGPFDKIYYEDFEYDDWLGYSGTARFEQNGKIGYIDADGTIVSEAIYPKEDTDETESDESKDIYWNENIVNT